MQILEPYVSSWEPIVLVARAQWVCAVLYTTGIISGADQVANNQSV